MNLLMEEGGRGFYDQHNFAGIAISRGTHTYSKLIDFSVWGADKFPWT